MRGLGSVALREQWNPFVRSSSPLVPKHDRTSGEKKPRDSGASILWGPFCSVKRRRGSAVRVLASEFLEPVARLEVDGLDFEIGIEIVPVAFDVVEREVGVVESHECVFGTDDEV